MANFFAISSPLTGFWRKGRSTLYEPSASSGSCASSGSSSGCATRWSSFLPIMRALFTRWTRTPRLSCGLGHCRSVGCAARRSRDAAGSRDCSDIARSGGSESIFGRFIEVRGPERCFPILFDDFRADPLRVYRGAARLRSPARRRPHGDRAQEPGARLSQAVAPAAGHGSSDRWRGSVFRAGTYAVALARASARCGGRFPQSSDATCPTAFATMWPSWGTCSGDLSACLEQPV